MARHAAKRSDHEIKRRQKQYHVNLDCGLADRLRQQAKKKPHYKKFIAAWDKINHLEREGKLGQIDGDKRSKMLMDFLNIAHALLEKYDTHLKNPKRAPDHERYIQRMQAVFLITISERLQTQFGKNDFTRINDVTETMEAIRAIANRRDLPTVFIP